MNFRASFCDPLKQYPTEFGNVEKDKIIEMFEKIPWAEHLEKMKTASKKEIYCSSPIFEVVNNDNENGLLICAIDGTEWYIYYARPRTKLVKKFFKQVEETETYITDAYGQTENDVRMCVKALIENDLQFLENKINLPNDYEKWRGY